MSTSREADRYVDGSIISKKGANNTMNEAAPSTPIHAGEEKAFYDTSPEVSRARARYVYKHRQKREEKGGYDEEEHPWVIIRS